MTPVSKASTAEQVHQALVEQRLFRYAGCSGYVQRWFIIADKVPMPYRTEAEALAELRRRQDAGERRGQP